MLPHWFDTRDPEAQRGTMRVRCADPELIVGLDRRRMVYQVWCPSRTAGGWVPMFDVTDGFGVAYRGGVPWDLVVGIILRARADGERAGDTVADRVEEHNARLRARRDREQIERVGEVAKFAHRAVAGEAEGWGRHTARDVGEALQKARGETPPPVGLVISVARGQRAEERGKREAT